MSETLSFDLLDSSGSRLAGAPARFLLYVDRFKVARDPPTINDLTDGGYSFTMTKADVDAGTAFLIDAGLGSFPSFLVGAGYNEDAPLIAAAFLTPDGGIYLDEEPPTFGYFKAGSPRTPPAFSNLEGLWLASPSAADALAHVVYRIDAPGDSSPLSFSGFCNGLEASQVRPVVSNFAPALPGPLAATQALSFDVTVSDGTALALVAVSIDFPTTEREGVYNGTTFAPNYAAASYVEAITNGLRVHLKRRGGWLGRPDVDVRAVTASGMVNV